MENKKKKVAYIAGKISGKKNYIYDFVDAEQVFRHLGYVVLSPIKIPLGLEWDQYMRIDIAMIKEVDTVVFLKGWEKSKGATIEHEYAEENGKTIIEYDRRKLIVETEENVDIGNRSWERGKRVRSCK